jgi:hypothetical protein
MILRYDVNRYLGVCGNCERERQRKKYTEINALVLQSEGGEIE